MGGRGPARLIPMRKTIALYAVLIAAFLLIPVLLAAQEPVLALRAPADTVRLSLDDALRLAEETAFAARLPPGFEVRISDEHAEHAWLPPEDAMARLRFPGLRKAVRLATGSP